MSPVSDDDRVRYLAGEAVPLDPDEQSDLDDLRALLADPALWAEPDAGLEDRIVDAIGVADRLGPPAGAQTRTRVSPRRRRRLALVVAAAAAVAAAVGLAVGLTGGGSGPETFHAALAGTALDPGVSGHATLTKTISGWRVTLHATGLARLDNGEYYEAWLKNRAGVLVAIGTFNQPDKVTLWSGVPPTSFPTLTVTRQRADGNPASSGIRVLTGTAEPGG